MKILIFTLLILLAAGCARTNIEESEDNILKLTRAIEMTPTSKKNKQIETTEPAVTLPPTSNIVRSILEDYGPAPELNNEIWLNSEQPLRLENLRGKVVLIDMWTFG